MRAELKAIALVLSLAAVCGYGQTAPENASLDRPHRDWQASWVTHPTAPLRDPLVLHFRRSLTLEAIPASYRVRVSADNRFVLYVNGERVGDGPARGDLAHWRYELFDLAPLLRVGKNLITATVWNWGVFAPVAQISDRTAFLLESEATGDEGISTPDGWQVEIEPGREPLDRSSVDLKTYMAAGPGEEFSAAHYDWNWQSDSDGSTGWVNVASPMRDVISASANKAHSSNSTADNLWGLTPDTLPHMEYEPTEVGRTVRVDAAKSFTAAPALRAFPTSAVTIPAGTHVHILLDRKTLITAYPILAVTGGRGAQIWLTYSEALYDEEMHKGDRDEVEDRTAHGLKDHFLPDGGRERVFEPLWWRTWRYLDLDIQTGDRPLTLNSLQARYTAYPFKEQATFESSDEELKKIWDISWRTAQLDAHETYMDTPYHEQLQYVGDTRIQALISYAVTGDDRLARQALKAFDDSRSPDGLTRSRYPSSLPQTIPTFSLLWVGMVRDWWMYRPDAGPAVAAIPGTRTVMDWFAQYEQPDGLLKQLPWWSFIDWVPEGTIPTYDANGESCMTTLEYLGALEDAAALEQGLGDPQRAARYEGRAAHVRSGLLSKCWNGVQGLLAETSGRNDYSQQANILGVLYDVVPKERQQGVMRRMLVIDPGTTPTGILSASYYFRFYLARALEHAGMADEYLRSIDPWRKLLPMHFSTWPEVPGETRSDSHAWTAHPIYDLLTLVAGIEPASPGFETVRIAPHMGELPSLTATYPHPAGEIRVEYTRDGGGLNAKITLPGSLKGSFVLNGKAWPLKPGENSIQAR
jgi:alpha-L-rhamnosidase